MVSDGEAFTGVQALGVFLFFFFVAGIARGVMIFLHRGWFRQGFFADSSTHYSIISQIRKDSGCARVEQYVIPNTMSYPLGFHRFASLFPDNVLGRYSFLPNLIVFAFFSALFLSFVYYAETMVLGYEDGVVALIAAIVYFASVSNLVFAGAAIAYLKLSERLLGRMSCAFYYLGISVYALWGDMPSAVIAVVAGAIALMSSTFAAQLLIFTAPLLVLVFLNPLLVWVFAGAVLLSGLMSRFYSFTSIRHMIRYWKIYKRFVKKNITLQDSLSKFVDFKALRKAIMARDFRAVLLHLTTREPSRVILFFPEIILLAGLTWLGQDTADTRLLLPLLPILIVFLLTTTDRFHHLGESYRYIEYGLYFYLPLMVAILFRGVSQEGLVPAYVMLGLYVLWVLMLAVASFAVKEPYQKRDQLSDFLTQIDLSDDAVVFPVPMRLGADICARVSCKSFWWQPGGITDPDMYQELIEEYPYLKKDWKPLCLRFGATHIVVNKNRLQFIDWSYDFSGQQLLYEDDNYIAYKVVL